MKILPSKMSSHLPKIEGCGYPILSCFNDAAKLLNTRGPLSKPVPSLLIVSANVVVQGFLKTNELANHFLFFVQRSGLRD